MDLINKMLALKPEERLDIKSIKDHKWYKGNVLLPKDFQDNFIKRQKIIN
jgi:serine/threonine protein kinase